MWKGGLISSTAAQGIYSSKNGEDQQHRRNQTNIDTIVKNQQFLEYINSTINVKVIKSTTPKTIPSANPPITTLPNKNSNVNVKNKASLQTNVCSNETNQERAKISHLKHQTLLFDRDGEDSLNRLVVSSNSPQQHQSYFLLAGPQQRHPIKSHRDAITSPKQTIDKNCMKKPQVLNEKKKQTVPQTKSESKKKHRNNSEQNIPRPFFPFGTNSNIAQTLTHSQANQITSNSQIPSHQMLLLSNISNGHRASSATYTQKIFQEPNQTNQTKNPYNPNPNENYSSGKISQTAAHTQSSCLSLGKQQQQPNVKNILIAQNTSHSNSTTTNCYVSSNAYLERSRASDLSHEQSVTEKVSVEKKAIEQFRSKINPPASEVRNKVDSLKKKNSEIQRFFEIFAAQQGGFEENKKTAINPNKEDKVQMQDEGRIMINGQKFKEYMPQEGLIIKHQEEPEGEDEDDDDDIRNLQYLSSPLLRSSSSSKEPNRRYEKQSIDKKLDLNKKIQKFLESRQIENTSKDLASYNNDQENLQNFKNPQNSMNPQMPKQQEPEGRNVFFSQTSPQTSYFDSTQQLFTTTDSQGSVIHFKDKDKHIHSNNNDSSPFRSKQFQAKSTSNQCHVITPSTCDGKKQLMTIQSPIISHFVPSSSSPKVISFSPNPFLTTENDEDDLRIALEQRFQAQTSLDTCQTERTLLTERDQPEDTQAQFNDRLEQRLGLLETEMSSVLQRCINLEVQNKSLTINIGQISSERDLILQENEVHKQRIEELRTINKQQERTIQYYISKLSSQQKPANQIESSYRLGIKDMNLSQMKSTRSNISNQILKQFIKNERIQINNLTISTESSTSEVSHRIGDNHHSSLVQSKGFIIPDAFFSARGTISSTQNSQKGKKEINQYFSNMINSSQSKQTLLPQTFQGYLSQKSAQVIGLYSQNNTLTHNDSQNGQRIQTKTQSPSSTLFSGQDVDQSSQASSFRNEYYLSTRHGTQNNHK